MTKRRVVITGLGAVTPFGVGVDKFWNSLVEGKSGISTSELIDISKHVVKISGECKNFNPEEYLDPKEAKKMAIDYMDKVGIPDAEKRFNEYPFQYSGGMRQRIVIAIALACRPDVLICDEPTTALDVTIQAQIIDLLKSLKEEYGFSVIFITHDLGVVASIADKVAVMYAGEIIEYATVEEIFYEPCHPYTWSLLSSLPQLADDKGELFSIPGTPPSLYTPVVGDAFALRSDYAMQIDFEEKAPQFQVSDTHWAKTWLLHEDAPKVEKPAVIQNLHEKIRANMGFAHLGDEEEGNA